MDIERFVEEAEREAARRPTAPSAHPDEALLWAYVTDDLPEEGSWEVAAHLAGCPRCAAHVETLKEELDELEAQLKDHLPVPQTVGPERRSWADRLRRALREGLQWEYWVRHAAAYALGSLVLLGVNAALNELFPPPVNPLGSPAPPSWWAPYAIGIWSGLLAVHGLLILWKSRRRR